jgi:putative transposase
MEGDFRRQPQWTESIAVGDKDYVERVKDQMGYKAIGRKVVEGIDSFVLKETQRPYKSISDKAIQEHSEDNTFYWRNGTEANPDLNVSLEGSF